MDPYEQAIAYLPPHLQAIARQVKPSVREQIHEIRLRVNAPLTFSTAEGNRDMASSPTVTQTDIDECVLRLCGYSIHTHQEEIRQGFICTDSGCRAGIGGTVVTDRDRVMTIRDITSVCLRVARPHIGCAATVLPHILARDSLASTLLVGAPSSGKTSLLRDAAATLATGYGGRKWRVAVIDERGELAVGERLTECDVLRGGNKAHSIEQAVRCLAPQIVVFDEWGGEEECRAVEDCLQCGVAVLTSCHAGSARELWKRPAVSEVLRAGGIEHIAELSGYRLAGTVARWIEVEDWIAENHRIDLCGRDGDRNRLQKCVDAETARRRIREISPTADLYGEPCAIHGGADTDDTGRSAARWI